MSKETKLGLLGGMGVIILVAILVTDLLSVADRQEPAPMYQNVRAEQVAEPAPPAVTGTPATFQQRSDPLPLPQEVDRAGHENITPAQQLENAGVPFAGSVETRRIETGRRQFGPVIGDSGHDEQSDSSAVYHIVREGEDLSTIAKRYLGSPGKWQAIHQANRRAVPNPNVLRPGVRLVIPVQGAEAPTGDSPPTALRPYEVQKGDTLAKLAEQILGNADQWKQLHALNIDRIRDPHRLIVGMVILVPDR